MTPSSSWVNQWTSWSSAFLSDVSAEVRKLEEQNLSSVQEEEDIPDGKQAEREDPGFLGKAKQELTRPIVLWGQNYNSLTENIAEEAQKVQEKIIHKVDEVRSSVKEQKSIFIPDAIDPLPSASSEPLLSPLEAEMRPLESEETQIAIAEFEKRMTAYATFFILHEMIAGQEFPVNEQNEPVIYQKMIQRAAAHPELTLWQIYYEELGQRLDSFSYMKARIFYLIFYSFSNFIPKVTHELLQGVVRGFQERFSQDSYHMDNFARALLCYMEDHVKAARRGLEKAAEKGKSVDRQKEKEVLRLFKDDFLALLIEQASSRSVDLFFPDIAFCELGKDSTFAPAKWIGRVICTLINHPLNSLVRFILKRWIAPAIFRIMIQKALSDESTEAYIFRGALYRVTLQTLPSLSFNKSSEKKEREPLPEEKKLKTIAADLVKILEAPQKETSPNLLAYCEENKSSFDDEMLQQAIEQGIIKAGEVVIDLLNDQQVLENLFRNILQASNEALVCHNDFAELKKDCARQKKDLDFQLKKLLSDEIRLLIQNISNMQAVDEKTGRARHVLQEKSEETVGNLEENLTQIRQSIKRADSYLEEPSIDRDGHFSECLPIETLSSIEAICIMMKDFTHSMDVKTFAPGASTEEDALIQITDNMLHPLRIRALAVMESIDALNKDQNIYYLQFGSYQHILQVLSLLKAVQGKLREDSLGSEQLFKKAFFHLKKICTLSLYLDQFISPEDKEKIIQDAAAFLKQLKEIDERQKSINDLRSLIDREGPAGLLIRSRQGSKAAALQNFDAEKTKDSIREALQRAGLYEKLSPLLDPMLKFLPSSQRKSWENLKHLILDDLPAGSIKIEFEAALDEWQELPRGSQFDQRLWEEKRGEFFETLRRKKLSSPEIEPRLEQIRAFLAHDLINAYWNRFCQKAGEEQNRLIRENKEQKRIYEEGAHHLFDFLEGRAQHLKERQKTTSVNLEKSLHKVFSEIRSLEQEAHNLEAKTPFSTGATLKTVGLAAGAGVGMAAAGILPVAIAAPLVSGIARYASSFFRSNRIIPTLQSVGLGLTAAAILPLPPVFLGAAVGAAAFGYAANKIPDTAVEYSEEKVVPRLEALVDRALEELSKAYTRKGVIYAGLKGFVHGGYRGTDDQNLYEIPQAQ